MNHLRSLKINLIRFKSRKKFLNCIKYIFCFQKIFQAILVNIQGWKSQTIKTKILRENN